MTVGADYGILNVVKPVGMTSFGVVARIRRIMNIRRVGHCGTLDPFADGVLPVLLGRATGVARYMESYSKSYRVTVRFGRFTDTQDRTGNPCGGRDPSDAELAAMQEDGYRSIREAVESLAGERLQTPPMYSAVKIDGRPLYAYARKGLEIERAARPVTVFRSLPLEIAVRDGMLEADVEIDCSKGTYIRTLCSDLGETTGFGAHAAALTRTACGPFRLEETVSLENLETIAASAGDARWDALRTTGVLLPMESALRDMPALRIGFDDALHMIHGRPFMPGDRLSPAAYADGTRMAVSGPDGFLGVGVLRRDGDGITWIHAERVFADREDH